jgi:uncharacterized protein
VPSFWHRDHRETNLVFVQDRTLYPVEVKKSASPNPGWLGFFGPLGRLKNKVGEAGVVCLSSELLPLGEKAHAIPVGWL